MGADEPVAPGLSLRCKSQRPPATNTTSGHQLVWCCSIAARRKRRQYIDRQDYRRSERDQKDCLALANHSRELCVCSEDQRIYWRTCGDCDQVICGKHAVKVACIDQERIIPVQGMETFWIWMIEWIHICYGAVIINIIDNIWYCIDSWIWSMVGRSSGVLIS